MNDALQQALHHDMYNVGRGFHLSISGVEGVQTLKEPYPKDGQQLPTTVSTGRATLRCPYSKKYPRLAKHPGDAYLHGPDILIAIEHSNKFCTISALDETTGGRGNRRTHPSGRFLKTVRFENDQIRTI